jgi:hypothetical protein
MNSSPTTDNDPYPFAASGGVERTFRNEDSVARWIELMDLVEPLCPKWPERGHKIDGIFPL